MLYVIPFLAALVAGVLAAPATVALALAQRYWQRRRSPGSLYLYSFLTLYLCACFGLALWALARG